MSANHLDNLNNLIQHYCDEHGLDPQGYKLNIAEGTTLVMTDSELLHELKEDLRMGCTLAVKDNYVHSINLDNISILTEYPLEVLQ